MPKKKKKTNKEFWEKLPKEYWDCFLELEHCMQETIELEHLLDDAFDNMVKLAKKRDLKTMKMAKRAHEKAIEILEKVAFSEEVLYAIIRYVDDLEDSIAFHKVEAADVLAALDDIESEIEWPTVKLNQKMSYVYDWLKDYADKNTYRHIKEKRRNDEMKERESDG